MKDERQPLSFYEKAYTPALQGVIVLVIVFVFMLGAKFMSMTGAMEISKEFYWLTATSFMLFFGLFNSVFSLSCKDINQYWGRSMLAFAGLALATGLLAYLFSATSIHDVGPYKWIYVVLIFGYLVFLSIMGFMKRIVEFAEREEWQAPRKRNR
ncbi:MAG: hypothetical protein AAF985_10645 [Bacteroidota bacterium]